MCGGLEPRNHQSLGLEAHARGENVVIATGTASGKSLVFQAAMIRELLGGEGRVLLMFPQKALVVDDARLAPRACRARPRACRHDPRRDPDGRTLRILRDCQIVLATPDVVHSWDDAPARLAARPRLPCTYAPGGHRRSTHARRPVREHRRLLLAPVTGGPPPLQRHGAEIHRGNRHHHRSGAAHAAADRLRIHGDHRGRQRRAVPRADVAPRRRPGLWRRCRAARGGRRSGARRHHPPERVHPVQ